MTRALAGASYALLGCLLLWSRLFGLDNGGYCCDEIRTVVDYVRAEPETIFSGPYVPNNHQLFSLLSWATSSVFGESEVALRLGAAIPFILAVVLVTAWLHSRAGVLAASCYLGLTTLSPLLLDLSRLARGYGLAFLAMSVMVVAAFEALRNGRTSAIVAFWVAGLLGTWTLPHLGIAFAAIGVVLSLHSGLRTRCLVGACVSSVATAIWYAPHFDDILVSSSQPYGREISSAWLATSPFDQILIPAFTSLDDSLGIPSLATLLIGVALALVIGSSPLLRSLDTTSVLCAPVVVTLVAFWATGTNVVPRFFSFLLVPLFILIATGTAAISAELGQRRAGVRTAIAGAMLSAAVVVSIPVVVDVLRLPRDSTREAAAAINTSAPATAPVYAHVAYPHDLAFHLRRSVRSVQASQEARLVCAAAGVAVYVDQPFLVQDAVVPCTRRAGTRHYRFEQYARGGEINVWIIPSARS